MKKTLFLLVMCLPVLSPLFAGHKTEVFVEANCFVECKASSNGKVWLEVPVLVVSDPFSRINLNWTFFRWQIWDYEGAIWEFMDDVDDLDVDDLNDHVSPPIKLYDGGVYEINFCEDFERNFTGDVAPPSWQLRILLIGEVDTSDLPLPEDWVPTVPWIKNFTGSFRRSSTSPPQINPDSFFDPIRGVVTGIAKTTCQLSRLYLESVPDAPTLKELGPGCRRTKTGSVYCAQPM